MTQLFSADVGVTFTDLAVLDDYGVVLSADGDVDGAVTSARRSAGP